MLQVKLKRAQTPLQLFVYAHVLLHIIGGSEYDA